MQPQMPQLSQDPKTNAAQMAMIKVLSTPPEPILNLFERLGIPWERVKIDGQTHCVIRWSDLMEGERRNQAEGPFIKKVVEELKGDLATEFAKAEPEQHVEREVTVETEED